MAETVLDSLVVRIGADVAGLERGLDSATDSLGEAADRAAGRMTSAFERMARNGSFSFETLKSNALAALAEIATAVLTSGLERLLGGLFGGGGLRPPHSTIFVPGRAGGGAVAPDRPFLVGERGPEVFIPHTAGRINPDPGLAGRSSATIAPSITVNVTGVREERDLNHSATQVALAVSRALNQARRGL
ncbi:MAG: tail tape measure protein [Alphaproteobacteria bacterium]|nr:MAG: tail tape measure protein [Alphaproteobacteria bacterium]